MKLETRMARLLSHLEVRIVEECLLTEWVEELDAIRDVLTNNVGGMKEWTVTKDGELIWK